MGLEIGLTRERVRQIQVDALRRLRDVLRKHGLNGDLLFRNSKKPDFWQNKKTQPWLGFLTLCTAVHGGRWLITQPGSARGSNDFSAGHQHCPIRQL